MTDKLAFIFPGQGAQNVGMCEDYYNEFELAREKFEKVHDVLGLDIRKVMVEGPPRELEESKNAQVAIFLHSMVVNDLLEARGISPAVVAGHSLGEYSALCSAGALTFEDGLKLLRKRGELMSAAGKDNPGNMAAILGLGIEEVEEICDQVSGEGYLVRTANHNTAKQIVVSGEPEGVDRAQKIARKKGARRVVELSVSGAFHTPLMEPAQDKFTEAIDEVEFSDAEVPVITNTTAKPVEKEQDIMDELKKHMLSAVQWYDSIQHMIEDGIETFVEVGPGKTLRGMLLRINRRKAVLSTYDLDEFKHTLDQVEAESDA